VIGKSLRTDKFEGQIQYMLNNVFIIDDDPISNLVSETVLRKNQFSENYHVFEDANKALEELDKLKPELIFLDIVMPKMNGWQFLENFKNKSNLLNSKVVLLTASLKSEDEEKADKISEVIDIISKPLSKEFIEELKNRIGH
jgi:CheY-like chemotaxis protein